MKNQFTPNLKDSKGITMITLVVSIFILILISGMTIYYSKETINSRNLRRMYNDIELLNDAVETYYTKSGEIPVLTKYSNTENLKSDEGKNPNDNDIYYVIDLSRLENISLKYGRDFEKIKENYNSEGYTESDYTDVYVINEQSLQIYYIKGILASENKYKHTVENNISNIELKVTKISSVEDLIRFEQAVNGGDNFSGRYIVLSGNLDFKSKDSYDGTTVTINGQEYAYGEINNLQTYLLEGGTGFTPIGTESNQFSGTFDGKEYEIRNIYISQSGLSNVGLFGVSSGAIKNVSIIDGKIEGGSNVGGICGSNNGIIDNCINYSTKIIGNGDRVGGICGLLNSNGVISNCGNSGNIEIVTGKYTGGILGYNKSTLETSIYNCYNTGIIDGIDQCGGILGYTISTTNIAMCYNAGNVSGYSLCGGIIGHLWKATIENCYNAGNITVMLITDSIETQYSNSYSGGIVGANRGSIINTYNTGKITNESNLKVGAITGSNYASNNYFTIQNSYWLTGTADVGADQTNEENTPIEVTEQELKNIDLGDNWTQDPKTLYPILKWQVK